LSSVVSKLITFDTASPSI